jgi:hypothetical protein
MLLVLSVHLIFFCSDSIFCAAVASFASTAIEKASIENSTTEKVAAMAVLCKYLSERVFVAEATRSNIVDLLGALVLVLEAVRVKPSDSLQAK